MYKIVHLLGAARTRGVCPDRKNCESAISTIVQLALMGFARYLRELRKHFLNSRVQLARVGFAFVLVSCGNVARTHGVQHARVGFASF